MDPPSSGDRQTARARDELGVLRGQQAADADAIAASLGIPDSAVLPVSPATPVTNATGADVVLVIGADLAAKTPPSTVPPTTTTTVAKTTTTTTKATKSSSAS